MSSDEEQPQWVATSPIAEWVATTPIAVAEEDSSDSDESDNEERLERGLSSKASLSSAVANVEDVRTAAMFEFLRTGFWFGMATAIGWGTYSIFFGQDVLLVDMHERPCADVLGMNDFKNVSDTHRLRHYISVYRDFGLLALWPMCWALLTCIWSQYNIDYYAILRLNASMVEKLNGSNAVIAASKMIIIWGLNRAIFNHMTECRLILGFLFEYSNYMPGVMIACLIAFSLHWSGCVFPRLVVAAVLSPFTRVGVTEKDSYVANWLTSLVKPANGAAYGMCLYVSGQFLRGGPSPDDVCHEQFFGHESSVTAAYVILLAPNVLRILQNLRQMISTRKRHPALTNAGKYLTSCLVTLFGLVHGHAITYESHPRFVVLWLSLIIFKSLYAFAWDITEDWGMFTSSSKFLCFPCGRISLRKERIFSDAAGPYMCAMFANFVARFFSTLTFLPPNSMTFQDEIIGSFVFLSPFVEILRRSMWSALKFEYKQAKKNKEMEKKGSPPLMLALQTRHSILKKDTMIVTERNKSYMRRELFVFAILTALALAIIFRLEVN
eukprot:TRINITY_DN46707_c0_g1_i1.p1 TRINITY_DN46707_c0_g1~~TRINITY_DN46707_c0_g1_i1.p1  ORF type:complete len:552 (+),score=49.39 TRINITY_DN46707_c0_g1_i1:34-1689(+)